MSQIEPLFMFGFERSGTTLLSMMMGAHPEVAVPLSATGLWYRYAKRVEDYAGLADNDSAKRIVHDLLGEERVTMWDEALTGDDVLPRVRTGSYASVVAAFHAAYAARKGKPYWASMDISTLYNMDRANAWFPTAKFLHIVRDGRDVALSHETYRYGLSTTTEVANHWRQDLTTSFKMGAMIGPERYMRIRYEDLILNSTETLSKVCEFVGIDYDAEMLNYPQMVRTKVPEDRRFLWPALSEPPKKSKTFRWKKQMAKHKRIVFEARAKDMLDELGYETYDIILPSVGARFYDFWCYLGEGGRIDRLKSKLGLGGR